MKTVYLSLGSNLGDREARLREAVGKLDADDVHVLRSSPVYETEPQDVKEQGWFLNAVIEAETELFPIQLLERTQKIEWELGRRRSKPGGPRAIDIDILLYGHAVVHMPLLDIPHPRMTSRRFVLEPLAQLAPKLRHPVLGRTINEILADVQGQPVIATAITL